MTMNHTIQILTMITSIAYTTEEDQGLIQMTMILIILKQVLITSTVYIMQEDQALIRMIMNPTI